MNKNNSIPKRFFARTGPRSVWEFNLSCHKIKKSQKNMLILCRELKPQDLRSRVHLLTSALEGECADLAYEVLELNHSIMNQIIKFQNGFLPIQGQGRFWNLIYLAIKSENLKRIC